MLFLREFAAAEMGDSEPNGSEIVSDNAIPASAKPEKVSSGGIAKRGEAFVPTYVYEAMRENKRFDTMRVSAGWRCTSIFSLLTTLPSAARTPGRRGGIHGLLPRDLARGVAIPRFAP